MNNANQIRSSIRLTEIYREIEPAPDTGFWPFSDKDGTQYILFNAKDNSICYYREDNDGFTRHSLGASGTLVDVCGCPVPNKIPSYLYDSAAELLIKADNGTYTFAHALVRNKVLEYERSISEMGKPYVKTSSAFCDGDGVTAIVHEHVGDYYNLHFYAHGNSDRVLYLVSQFRTNEFPNYPCGTVVLPDKVIDQPVSMLSYTFSQQSSLINGKYYIKSIFAHANNSQKTLDRMDSTIDVGPLPDDMGPFTLKDVISVVFDREDSYVLFLTEKNNKKELWMAKYYVNSWKFDGFVKLDTSHLEDITKINASAVCCKGKKLISMTLADNVNHPDRVYHCFYDVLTSNQTKLMPILENVIDFKDCPNAQYEHIIYYSKKDKKGDIRLCRLSYDFIDDEWEEELVLDGVEMSLRPVNAYEYLISVSNADGTSANNVPVTIWADNHLLIETGSAFYPIGPGKSASLTTSPSGTLHLYHETHSLTDSDIHLDITLSNQTLNHKVSAAEFQQNKFKTMQANDLKNAIDSDGNYILSEERRRDDATLNNVTKSIRDIANTVNSDGYFISGSRGFILDLQKDGSVNRTELQSDEFQALRDKIIDEYGGFFTKVGDFFKGLYEKAVKVVRYVVEKANTIIEFILDGVTMFIEFVMDTAHKVINAIETVFGLILDLMQPFFDWLGDLIGLGSIKRTQSAIKYIFTEGIKFTTTKITDYRAKLKGYFDTISQKIDTSIDNVCKTLTGKTVKDMQSREKAISDSVGNISVSDNYVMDALINNLDSIRLPDDFCNNINEPLKDLWDYMQELANTVQNETAFKEAIEYLKSISTSEGKFITNSLAALLKALAGILKVSISLISTATDHFFDLGVKCLQSLASLAETKLEIPFLRSLFKATFAQDLTVMNLASLLIAMPTNIFTKLILDRVPFRNDGELETFKTDLKNLLNGNTSEFAANADFFKIAFSINYGAQATVYILTTIGDISSARNDKNISIPIDLITFISGGLWLFASVPSLFMSDEPVSTIGRFMMCVVGLFVAFESLNMKSSDANKTCVETINGIIGLMYLGFNIYGWSVKGITTVDGFLNELAISLQYIGRFLTIPAVKQSTKGISLAIEVLLNLFATAMAVVEIVITLRTNEEHEMLHA